NENITCFLFDENIVELNPLYNITVGGVKLKIDKADLDEATTIIEEITNDQGEIIQCPNCQSEDIYSGFKSMKGARGVLSAITSFLFMVFPIYYKTVYKCKSCINEFK
ncbi:MAG: DUF2007 domain-containing protein, partial [Bacteroidota bacterium]